MSYELTIQNNNTIYLPCIEDGITMNTERRGTPGKLEFVVLKDDNIDFEEGNAVRFKDNEDNIFFGFVFSKKRNKDKKITVTAYDQLRYLKNKDTYLYTNKTASEVVKMIANDFSLNMREDCRHEIQNSFLF